MLSLDQLENSVRHGPPRTNWKTNPLARRDIKIDAIYDIECHNWTEFVTGGVLGIDGTWHRYDFGQEREFVADILSRKAVWAHFGGKYDHQWLLKEMLEQYDHAPSELLPVGSRLIYFKTHTGTELFDSFALAPIKLAKLTASQNVTKQELNFPCNCGRKCGGYCYISRNLKYRHPDKWLKLVTYLEADCRSLMEALMKLRGYAAEHDLDIGRTIGGSAWRTVKRQLKLEDAPYSVEALHVYRLVQNGYFGGANQIYRRGRQRLVFEHDVNSMYPSALRDFAVPIGQPRYITNGKEAYDKATPGAYRAKVLVSDKVYIPTLPLRLGGDRRLYFPTGVFDGVWCWPELEYATRHGATILEIEDAVVFDEEKRIFTEWINKLWAMRSDKAHGGKKSPLGEWLKFFCNSLTGKFGSRPDKERWLVDPDPEKIRYCHCRCRTCGEDRLCECHPKNRPEICLCKSMRPIHSRIWSEDCFSIDQCNHVEWSMYLTAQSRIRLREGQFSDGHQGALSIQCDTDSNFSLARMAVTGDNLGQFGYEGLWRWIHCLAPKVYFGQKFNWNKDRCWKCDKEYKERDKDLANCACGFPFGEWEETTKSHAKGVKLLVSEVPVAGRLYEFDAPGGFRKGFKNGLFRTETITRTLSLRSGGRMPLSDDEAICFGATFELEPERCKGMTRAFTIEECILDTHNKLDIPQELLR